MCANAFQKFKKKLLKRLDLGISTTEQIVSRPSADCGPDFGLPFWRLSQSEAETFDQLVGIPPLNSAPT